MTAAVDHERQEIRREFWSGVIVAAALTALNVVVEHTSFGSDVRVFTYKQVHRWLPKAPTDDVFVVDLTAVPLEVNEHGYAVTDPEVLRRVALALADAHVAAIGLDCYLPHAPDGELTDKDKKLFDELMKIRAGESRERPIPVFFGARAFPSKPSNGWLCDPRYDELAAHVKGDGLKLAGGPAQREAPTVYTWFATADRQYRIDGLGVALVRAARKMPPEATHMRHFWTENVEPHKEPETCASILLDTTDVEATIPGRIRVDKDGHAPTLDECKAAIDAAATGGRLEGRIAIVGRADPDRHMDFPLLVPGRPKSLPGTYAHVAAVQTLRKGYLRQVTTLGTIVLDLALAIALLAGMAGYEQWRLRRGKPTVRPLTLAIVMAIPCFAVALLGGPLFAVGFRIIWDGAAFVAGALILHLLIEVMRHERHAHSATAH